MPPRPSLHAGGRGTLGYQTHECPPSGRRGDRDSGGIVGGMKLCCASVDTSLSDAYTKGAQGAATEEPTMTATIHTDQIVTYLTDEGYAREDVVSAINSMIVAGLSGDRDHPLHLTADEVQVIRTQLDGTTDGHRFAGGDPNYAVCECGARAIAISDRADGRHRYECEEARVSLGVH